MTTFQECISQTLRCGVTQAEIRMTTLQECISYALRCGVTQAEIDQIVAKPTALPIVEDVEHIVLDLTNLPKE